jgi:hypothetical protein
VVEIGGSMCGVTHLQERLAWLAYELNDMIDEVENVLTWEGLASAPGSRDLPAAGPTVRRTGPGRRPAA